MHIPESSELPVRVLASCFNNTSATYKFYWLLAILESVEEGKSTISKRELFARMISRAWFTVNYFHISFGKQDNIQSAVKYLNAITSIPIDDNQADVYSKLMADDNESVGQQLWHFNKNVPHKFLSPWLPGREPREVIRDSQLYENQCLYSLFEREIIVNPNWIPYLISNAKVLKDFCLWNLTLFLQARNPNVPDVPNKLLKRTTRNNLNKQRGFWDVVLDDLGGVSCIYTGAWLTKSNYAVEHFIPYGFVSHDLIWNLIPADRSFNSSKSDKLPLLPRHFTPFFNLQKDAVEIVARKYPDHKLLEDYLTIFPDFHASLTHQNFLDRIQPLVTIASNNGFEFLS